MKWGLRRSVLKWITRTVIAMWVVLVVSFAVLWYSVPVPVQRLHNWPASPQITDIRDRLLLEVVGTDDHWRRPVPLEQMSPWILWALIAVEDERFNSHGGVDMLAVCRAAVSNVRARRVVSGASTLTMQIGRMIDDCHGSVWTKAQQCLRAWQLEQIYSKQELLELYLNIAPFGGNIRGIESAARHYFDKSAIDLTLGESALLAGVPQSPTRLRPDRHPQQARRRREKVLGRMVEENMISAATASRTAGEAICIPPHRSRTKHAPHAAWMGLGLRPEGGRMTVDLDVQRDIERLVREQRTRLPADSDIAVVVIDMARSALTALVGSCQYNDGTAGQVNGARARRSSGSTLKPFIYALAFEQRMLEPNSVVYDVPISRSGWTPRNFDDTYRGTVTVREALQDSLNIPAILTLEALGTPRCIGLMRSLGMHVEPHAAERSGLAMAVGGLEVSLLELTQAYATLGRDGLYIPLRTFDDEHVVPGRRVLQAEVCRALNALLSSRQRPAAGLEMLPAQARPWFAWKTGTSSGRRDAWAVGHNGCYAIGVWVGRFGGSGDQTFTGARAAEPLLARCFAGPMLRRRAADPARHTPWSVTRPLAPPGERSGPPRILEPHDGARFLALDGSAHVSVRLNHRTPLHWFLNGRRIDDPSQGGLDLPPQRYTLRGVQGDGCATAVNFEVFAISDRGRRRLAP